MDVLMPQLGETVAEGKIVKWFVKAGDTVKPGDNLFEIETDKTSMEVPATFGGTLSDIHFSVGETAKVGAAVATIAVAGEATAPKQAPAGKPVAIPPHTPPVTPAQIGSPEPQSPLTPAKAGVQQEANLDSRLRGNERSLERAPRDFGYANMTPWREVRSPERNYGPAKLPSGTFVTPLARRLASERGIDLSRVFGSGPHGRIVAGDIANARAAETTQGVAQFTLVADVEIGRLLAMRDEAKAGGAEFALGDFAVKAWAAALTRVTPSAGTDIALMQNAVGQRVTTTLRNAAGKSLTAIARDAQAAATDETSATTAVYILPASGIRRFTAAVTPPFTSVLAIGAARRAPAEAEDGSVKFISVMTVTLSCDPRAVEDTLGVELLTAFKNIVEMPVTALV